jgi:hypothetical protein
MSPSEQFRSLSIVRGRDIGGTLIRRSSDRFRIMVNGHHTRFLGLRLAALRICSGRVDDEERARLMAAPLSAPSPSLLRLSTRAVR